MASRSGGQFEFPMQVFPPNGDKRLARIRHVHTPERFHITLTENENRYNKFFDEFQRLYTSLLEEKRIGPMLWPDGRPDVALDDHCVYRQDPYFFRGRVIDMKGSRLTIVDVDTGEVSKSVSMRTCLFPIVDNQLCRQTPMLAPLCKLPHILPTLSTKWDEVSVEKFVDNYTDRHLTVEFLHREEDVNIVKLFTRAERDVTDQMITMGLARRHRPAVSEYELPSLDIGVKVGEMVDVVVSFVSTTESFYVQLQSNKELLLKLCHDLNQEYYMNGDRYLDVRGKYCVVKNERDNRWYRAEIIARVSPSMVQVLFIDFGAKAPILRRDLRGLKLEFTSYPAQAVQCCLHDVHSLPVLSDRFSNLVLRSRRMTAKIHDVDYGVGKLTVTLFQTVDSDRYNINEYLAGKAEGPPTVSPLQRGAVRPSQPDDFEDDSAPGSSTRHRHPTGQMNPPGCYQSRARHQSHK